MIEMVLPEFDYGYAKLDGCPPDRTKLYCPAAEQKWGLVTGKWAPIPK